MDERRQVFKRMKFYDEDTYLKFLEMCRLQGSTITREINLWVNNSVKEGKLPSENSIIL